MNPANILTHPWRVAPARVADWMLVLSLLSLPLAQSTAAPRILRGPYLQSGTPSNVVVRWRTDLAAVGRVRFGTNHTNLDRLADAASSATNHSVLLPDLDPDTFYYYSVGTETETLAGGTNYLFRTSPPFGSRRPVRIWVLGDFGFTNRSAIPVRQAYDNFAANRYTDLWLMLGDNAYHGGSDSIWQMAVFNVYSNLLRQTVVWSTIGNQETGGASTISSTSPYLQNFTFPTAGEAGGVASGNENYYAFDYGNIHFICLDSMSSSRVAGSPMLQWLELDLQQNTSDWLIAFFHHPPYSRGSNNSDARQEQIEMRTNVVRILEAYGVDLVLCGHSHSYERSYLLDGHYGFSTTFTTNYLVDPGDGQISGDGAYTKSALGPQAHRGAVYVVAGSGAEVGGGTLNHPAMYRSLGVLGSLVLDIHANRLEAKFLRENGDIDDFFTLIKGDSPIRLEASRSQTTPETLTLQWNSVADRTYYLETVSALGDAWMDHTGPIRSDGILTSHTVPVNAGTNAFFRVRSQED